MLEFVDIVAGYGKFPVLKNFSLKIEEGSIVLLIGPNGAGKSTVLKTACGLTKIESGRILFRGEDITNIKPYLLIKHRISYVPQGRIIFPTLTVEENILIGGYSLTKHERMIRFGEIMEWFPELENIRPLRATFLSGGQQQIVAIARGLMIKPQILFLDEPTLGLSPIMQKKIFDEISKISRLMTIVVVEHNVKRAAVLADRIHVLKLGEIVLSGGPEILEGEALREIYLN